MWGTENWGLVAFGLVLWVVSAVLYVLGGTEGFRKWYRRFLASFLLAVAANVIALVLGKWNYWYALMWPALIGGFSLPYGANTMGKKILQRSVYGAGVLMASVFGAFATGWTDHAVGMIVMQTVLMACSVYLGVDNPLQYATLEQAFISLLLTFTLPFWAMVK